MLPDGLATATQTRDRELVLVSAIADCFHGRCFGNVRRLLMLNLRLLSQVRRRRVAAWTRLCPAGALAIGGLNPDSTQNGPARHSERCDLVATVKKPVGCVAR
jgi:hypothetical protein